MENNAKVKASVKAACDSELGPIPARLAQGGTKLIHNGAPARHIHLAPDGTTFRLCDKDDSELLASFRLDHPVADGDTITLAAFTLTIV